MSEQNFREREGAKSRRNSRTINQDEFVSESFAASRKQICTFTARQGSIYLPYPAIGLPSSPSLLALHSSPRVTRSKYRGSSTVALLCPMVVANTRVFPM